MIQIPPVPNLPLPQQEFSQLYLSQLTNILRLYFNQLTSAISNINTVISGIETGGGGYVLSMPYGAFSSGVTQTAVTNTATVLTYNSTDFSNTVSLVSGSQLKVKYAGTYNFQFSVQLQSLAVATEDVFIWLRQNGTDIVGSTGLIGMLPRKSAGNPSHGIFGWNYFVSLKANDYIEAIWSTTDGTNVTIPYYAASSSPTKPSTQSVVATLTFVSA